MNKKIIVFIFSTAIFFIPLFVYSTIQTDEELLVITPTNKLFNSEEEFQNYIINNVKFESIKFVKIKIKHRDNFWKIARKFKVNIDSLLSTNPYWKSLLARLNQEIIVPTERGTLHFINSYADIDNIAKMYGKTRENVSIQKLPFMYAYYQKFIEHKKPIAIFVHKAKPSNKIMTAEMAKKFIVREMFRSPLGGRFSSFFGNRRHPIFKRRKFHNGIDIASKYGTAVGAACAGTVISTGWMGGYGKTVIVQHRDGYKTLYGHLSRICTRRGRKIRAGQFIGRVGSTGNSTGPHLHFTLWKNGRLLNPMKILW